MAKIFMIGKTCYNFTEFQNNVFSVRPIDKGVRVDMCIGGIKKINFYVLHIDISEFIDLLENDPDKLLSFDWYDNADDLI